MKRKFEQIIESVDVTPVEEEYKIAKEIAKSMDKFEESESFAF